MLRTADLNYTLPEDLIATAPVEPRDSARLLVVSRSDPALLEHRFVRDLPDILRPVNSGTAAAPPPDVLVVNSSRVLAARFRGVRVDSGGQAEGLYIQPAPPSHPDAHRGPLWIVLLKMRRLKPGVVVNLLDRYGRDSGIRLRLIEPASTPGSSTADPAPATPGWIVLVESQSVALTPGLTAADVLDFVGLTPIPPYILAARRKTLAHITDEHDRSTYQTVYASTTNERPGHGSVAAPTAGLHFTPDLLRRLRDVGIHQHDVTLDVGLGTFKPVEAEFIEQHPMHTEWCSIPPTTASAIAATHAAPVGSPARGRVIAVGTTAARTLESFDSTHEMLRTRCKSTNILITPGYRFKHVDVLLTNFHLPQTTLLAMVAALFAQPPAATSTTNGGSDAPPISETDIHHAIDRLKAIYAEAIQHRYRFFSFGDAMLILP